ncbi:MAG: putative porin [Thermodesulfobacteriota bacterium]
MKKALLMWMGSLTLALGFTCVNMATAGESTKLLDKLVEKNVLTAEEAKSIQVVPSWVEKIKLSGDLRLRHDTQWREEGDHDYDRHRERFRLRLGLDAKTSDTTKVVVKLASGSGEQNSTNASFDDHARGKEIWIDQAYAAWDATDYLKVTGGKQANPLFTSSIVWDSDVNPEGLSESFNFEMTENAKMFINLGQWVVEELNSKEFNTDPMMTAWQAGGEFNLAEDIGLTVAATYYDFTHLDDLAWGDGVLGDDETFLGGNKSLGQQMIFDADGNLLNEFGCVEIGTRLKMKKVLPVPVSLFASYITNLEQDIDDLVEDGVNPGDSDPAKLLAYGGDDRDAGWQVGFDAGSKKKKGDIYFQYLYQELEDYAFPAVFVDSDFHGGGTNCKGHKLDVVYCVTDNVSLAAAGYMTEREDEDKDGQKDEDRLQLDAILKF